MNIKQVIWLSTTEKLNAMLRFHSDKVFDIQQDIENKGSWFVVTEGDPREVL